MKRLSWELRLGIALVCATIALNAVHYAFYHDLHHIVFWSLTNLAFLPLSVLFVTLVLEGVIARRERGRRLDKVNMLIGLFYSNAGRELMADIAGADTAFSALSAALKSIGAWGEREFRAPSAAVLQHPYTVAIGAVKLPCLQNFLAAKTDFFLRLLENPNLLEHERFTDLLRAVFHLTEELAHRPDLSRLPEQDLAHLAGDIARVYRLIVVEWVAYMGYLKHAYPYLFSLAVRMNPFDPAASPVIRDV